MPSGHDLAFSGLGSSFYSEREAQMHIDQQVPSSSQTKVPLKRSELLGLVSVLRS